MRQNRIVAFLAITALATAGFATDRVLSESFSMDQVERLTITNGVGSFTLTATDGEDIHVEVTLIPRRGGIFSSMSRAEEEVAAAELKADRGSDKLSLEVDSSSHEPRFEARWKVTAPSRLGLGLVQGVGDASVEGLAGGVDMEVGVGQAIVEVTGGNVGLSVGVGDATVKAPAAAYGSVDVSGGVGGAVVVVHGEVKKGRGFVSHSSRWRGDGPDSIEVEVGVGEAKVILE